MKIKKEELKLTDHGYYPVSCSYPSPEEKALKALLMAKGRLEKLEVLHRSDLFIGQDFNANVVYGVLTCKRPPTSLVVTQEWELIHFLTSGLPYTRLKRRWNECQEEIKLQLDVHSPDEYEYALSSQLPLRFYKPPRVIISELREIINPRSAPRSTVPKVPYFA